MTPSGSLPLCSSIALGGSGAFFQFLVSFAGVRGYQRSFVDLWFHPPKKQKIGNQIMISYIGANKHHRQRKFVRRSTKRSVVQSTCKMSRGWMMRRELRRFRLGGKSRFSDDGLKLRRNKNRCWFPDLGFQSCLVKLYVKKWQIPHCITNPLKSTSR